MEIQQYAAEKLCNMKRKSSKFSKATHRKWNQSNSDSSIPRAASLCEISIKICPFCAVRIISLIAFVSADVFFLAVYTCPRHFCALIDCQQQIERQKKKLPHTGGYSSKNNFKSSPDIEIMAPKIYIVFECPRPVLFKQVAAVVQYGYCQCFNWGNLCRICDGQARCAPSTTQNDMFTHESTRITCDIVQLIPPASHK